MECKRNRAHQEVHWQSGTYEQPTIGVRKTNPFLWSAGRSLSYSKEGACLRKSSGLHIDRREIQTQMLLLALRLGVCLIPETQISMQSWILCILISID